MSGYLYRGSPWLAEANRLIMELRASDDGHGSEAGLKRHQRAGNRPCAACREFTAALRRDRRALAREA